MSATRSAFVTWYSVLLLLCGDAQAADGFAHVPTGVIFSAALVEKTADRPFGEVTAPFWTPSPTDVAAAEAALRNYLETRGDRAANAIAVKLDTYRRQYLGDSPGGNRSILINAFCNGYLKHEPDWHRSFVIVLDGGDCFFRARFDPRTSTIEMFEVNGSA
jgi:hypothetical protein